MLIPRRSIVIGVPATLLATAVSACRGSAGTGSGAAVGGDPTSPAATMPLAPARKTGWHMPAEDRDHERTWMCWPSSRQVWGAELADVQAAIVRVALAIADHEPVMMLTRPEEIEALRGRVGDRIELLAAPVDDLWARDTLPSFLVSQDPQGSTELAAGHVQFNGWGDKQIHDGDAQLAKTVADHLKVPLIESRLVGEGGGLEVDGTGTVLAAESSWVNNNRNPDKSRDQIGDSLLAVLGADRMLWVEGLAGHDITDGHIDTLARFANSTTIVVDKPAYDDAEDPWVAVAARTRQLAESAVTAEGAPYQVVEITQPGKVRRGGTDFVATYMNYYVCNRAVIAPAFGDEAADTAAKDVLTSLFPGRTIVQVDIDPIAAGGGGIHCTTQQQPKAGV